MVRRRFCIILNEPLVSQNLSNHGIFPKESEAISRRCSAKNVFKIHRKTKVPNSNFNKVVGRSTTVSKNRLQHKCFPVN